MSPKAPGRLVGPLPLEPGVRAAWTGGPGVQRDQGQRAPSKDHAHSPGPKVLEAGRMGSGSLEWFSRSELSGALLFRERSLAGNAAPRPCPRPAALWTSRHPPKAQKLRSGSFECSSGNRECSLCVWGGPSMTSLTWKVGFVGSLRGHEAPWSESQTRRLQ